MGFKQKVEANGVLSGGQIMLDPRSSTKLDATCSVSDHKTPQDLSAVSPDSSNNIAKSQHLKSLLEPKEDTPFKKARVSVRARSEALMVRSY